MATTTGPDLTFARQQVERLMDDTCTITRDAEGTADDVLDDVTGDLVTPDPDIFTVYDADTLGEDDRPLGSRCKVSPNRDPRVAREGGAEILTGTYNGSLPWDAPEPAVGDVLKITSSRRDPNLVDKEFTIKDVAYGTFLVSRRLTLELRR